MNSSPHHVSSSTSRQSQGQAPGPSRDAPASGVEDIAAQQSPGNFNVCISFKKEKVRVRVNQDPDDLESTDSDSGPAIPYSPRPKFIGGFKKTSTFTVVGTDRPIRKYICEGNSYRRVRKVRGERSMMTLLECEQHEECNAVAFIYMGAMYLYGSHVPYIED